MSTLLRIATTYLLFTTGMVHGGPLSSKDNNNGQTTTITVVPTTTQAATSTVTCSTIEASASDAGSGKYIQYFSGSGVTENPKNPGNDKPKQFPPQNTTFSGTLQPCDALTQCGDFALGATELYYTFQLYFNKTAPTASQWMCEAYLNANRNASYFDISNENVGAAFGYNLRITD